MAGSKRFGCFWACVLAFAGMLVTAEFESSWALLAAGAIILLLLLSIGDRRRMVILLTVCFLAGSTIGAIYWSWWAVPVALGVVLAVVTTYRQWITKPLRQELGRSRQFNKERGAKSASDPSYSGGDGSTPAQAVVIQDVRSNRDGIRAEYEYLRRIYGERGKDWQLEGQSVFEREDGRQLDKMTVTTATGESETIYFDVSEFFGA